jgi:predicted enzyme related to lactoylglutathione lyase
MPASPFVWYELMTSDLAGAEAFYKTVIGWNADKMPGDMPYVIAKAGDTGVAGLMNIPDDAKAMGARPAWLGYIYAANVDKATESVKAAGGNVYREPSDIPSVGRFSVVTDPQGAVFMLFQPSGENQQPLPPNTPGTVGWRELYANDWEKAFNFYSSQFGWTKDQSMDMGPMGTYQLFAIDGNQAGGIMNRPENVPTPVWQFYFNVDGLDAAVARVKANGGKVLVEPMEVPGGSWIATCKDPQDATFSLVAPKR